MGLWRLDNPGRVGLDVAEYDNMPMVNIIREYVFNRDLDDPDTRVEFRRALLISSEVRKIQEGGRINV